jgi:NAD(P)-dependent dehydrogenase (short-subunit alcohol dehydrogenase family)
VRIRPARGTRRGFIRELGSASCPLQIRKSRAAPCCSPEQAGASATPPSSVSRRPAGASSPARATWEAGPEDHIQVDLSDDANTVEAIEEIKRRLDDGELHALVNNAAISPKADGGKRLGSLDTTVEVWRQVFRVNFFAPIMLARGLMDELRRAKGSVVNVTSIAGSRVHPFAGAAYATSKAALAALTREMASDFGRQGIRVNAIAPGEIDTSILSPGTEKIVEQIPMQRLGTTDEVAKIIYVLCTDTSSYVNGAEIHINGGQHV